MKINSPIDKKKKITKLVKTLAKKNSLEYPVNVTELLSKYASIEYEDYPFDADAICLIRDGKHIVLTKEDVSSEYRRRFTLAHELGHILIPWHIGTISCHIDENVNEVMNDDDYYSVESEANHFAAELLMPSDIVQEIIERNNSIEKILIETQEKFQVSLPALALNVIKYFETGLILQISGYFEEEYHQEHVSTGTNSLLTRDDRLCVSKEYFSISIYHFSVKRYPKEIFNNFYPEKSFVNSIEEIENLLIMNMKQYSNPYVAIEMISYQVYKGYIFIVVNRNNLSDFYWKKTRYTRVDLELKSIDDIRNIKSMVNFKVFSEGHLFIDGYDFTWIKIYEDYYFNKNVQIIGNSNDIIKLIVNSAIDYDLAKKFRYSINGIIGNVNSEQKIINEEDFYKRVIDKITMRPEFKEFYETDLFEKYLKAKANELISKNKM